MGNGDIHTLQTLEDNKASNLYNNNSKIKSHYITIFISYCTNKELWSQMKQELVEVIAYLCCLYGINPSDGEIISNTENLPTIASGINITGNKEHMDEYLAETCTIGTICTEVANLIMGNQDNVQHTTNSLVTTSKGELLTWDLDKDYDKFKERLDNYL